MNMKPIYCLIIMVIALVGLMTALVILKNTQNPPGTIENDSVLDYTFYTISEIKENNFSDGNYNTEGYVVKIYSCPICPKNARCKPCMRPNIVISENNNLLDSYNLTEREMIIFTGNPNPAQFELGSKYIFSVKITDYNSTGEPLNDVELIGYELAK